jgi:hypothetical protein
VFCDFVILNDCLGVRASLSARKQIPFLESAFFLHKTLKEPADFKGDEKPLKDYNSIVSFINTIKQF